MPLNPATDHVEDLLLSISQRDRIRWHVRSGHPRTIPRTWNECANSVCVARFACVFEAGAWRILVACLRQGAHGAALPNDAVTVDLAIDAGHPTTARYAEPAAAFPGRDVRGSRYQTPLA